MPKHASSANLNICRDLSYFNGRALHHMDTVPVPHKLIVIG